jgi:hypothetical protein
MTVLVLCNAFNIAVSHITRKFYHWLLFNNKYDNGVKIASNRKFALKVFFAYFSECITLKCKLVKRENFLVLQKIP